MASFNIDGVRYVTRITATLTRQERDKYSDWGGMVGLAKNTSRMPPVSGSCFFFLRFIIVVSCTSSNI